VYVERVDFERVSPVMCRWTMVLSSGQSFPAEAKAGNDFHPKKQLSDIALANDWSGFAKAWDQMKRENSGDGGFSQ